MRSSYKSEDVILLLKDITGVIVPQPTKEREMLIQAGKHYSEMLPIEYTPSETYMEAYREALKDYAEATALAVGRLSDLIMERRGKGVVLVSLARAGTPVGILLKHYIMWKYRVEIPHYSISIIRGRGIDQNAVRYLLERHRAEDLLFVDGWIGKGAILSELEKETAAFLGVSPELAVLADPAGMTELCGTHEDILIPSSCLNSTVSGLISRTFLRDDIILEGDFHGALYYGELEKQDLSYAFIRAIEAHFRRDNGRLEESVVGKGILEVEEIAERFGIVNRNLIKPGIGETTRVLLRRVPHKILIRTSCKGDKILEHVVRLAEEKQVPIEYYPLRNYRVCGIIKNMADV